MPAAKTITKKAAKAAKKPAQKTIKKVTSAERWENIEKGFERIQKTIDEVAKAHQETEKAIKETQKAHQETEKTLKRSQDEAWKAIKEMQRNLGGINNTLGSLVEHIMTPGLPGKFKQFGFTFDKITTVKWAVEGSLYAEIDGLLENGSQAMVVEVKTTLRRVDIDDHLERMEKVRKYADDHGDKRDFLGAMAATIVDKDTKEYALSKGFFVIEPSGEDIQITKPVSEKVW